MDQAQLTVEDLSDEFWERANRLTRLRREEQHQMQEYVEFEVGHMEFLIRALEGTRGCSSPELAAFADGSGAGFAARCVGLPPANQPAD